MKFAHISDTHLGYKQYGLLDRENDFFETFEKIIDNIIEERPDFVIHSGDFFSTEKPSTKTLLEVQKALSKLKDNNIPIYAIAGNHDKKMRKDSIPPQELYKYLGLKILDTFKPFHVLNDVFIGGTQYFSKVYLDSLLTQIEYIEHESSSYNKRILVLHQAVDKYFSLNHELEIGDIPKTFHYYAFGHIHNRIIDDYGEGKIGYPGCPEIFRADEIKNYKENGKGYHLIDFSTNTPEVELINIPLSREIINKTIEYSNMDNEMAELEDEISKYAKKPILKINIIGESINRPDAYTIVDKSINRSCLHYETNYNPIDVNEEEYSDDNNELDPNNILKFKLEKYDEKCQDFAIDLLHKTSHNDIEEAKYFARKFYEEL